MKQIIAALLAFLAISTPAWGAAAPPAPDRPYGIAVIGDPHLPGKELPAKVAALRTIDGWNDIDKVVVVGDISEETGSPAELAAATKYFAGLHKPLRPITGNHDFLYEDELIGGGRKARAAAEIRRMKLARFAKTFGLDDIYGSEEIGNYHVIYLSADDLESAHLTVLSDGQMDWFAKDLAAHRDRPTIVFFHAPLAGTLEPYNQNANTSNYIAQPVGRLRELIRENPQIFLWVAGHMHVPATNASYNAPVNLYEGQVTVIHNADMKRERIWTNVLYLYPDRVLVKTYDHGLKSWRTDLQRTIPAPKPRR